MIRLLLHLMVPLLRTSLLILRLLVEIISNLALILLSNFFLFLLALVLFILVPSRLRPNRGAMLQHVVKTEVEVALHRLRRIRRDFLRRLRGMRLLNRNLVRVCLFQL